MEKHCGMLERVGNLTGGELYVPVDRDGYTQPGAFRVGHSGRFDQDRQHHLEEAARRGRPLPAPACPVVRPACTWFAWDDRRSCSA